jgi:hypothetical protein
MALDDSLQAVAVAAGLVQLFGDWVVLAVAVHLWVMDYLLLQLQELKILVAVVVVAQVIR